MIAVPHIPSFYPLFVIVGVLLGYLASTAGRIASPLHSTARLHFTVVVVSAGMFGAYAVPWVASVLNYDREGGRSLLAGVLVAWCVAEILKGHLGIKGSTGDGYAIGLPLAAGIGRAGCLFGHCCLGIPSDSSWALEHDGQGYAPIALAEIVFHAAFFAISLGLTSCGYLPGQRLRIYVVGYGVFRFVSEWWRPHPRTIGCLSLYQWVAILLAIEVLWTIYRETIKIHQSSA